MADSLCHSCRLKECCIRSKTKIHTLLYSRKKYCEKVDEFYSLKLKLSILRQAISDERNKIQELNTDLSRLVMSNNKRNEWLKKVRKKDYQSKFKMAEADCKRKKASLNKELSVLQNTRQALIATITREIFPLKSSPVTMTTTDTREPTENMTTNLCLEDVVPIGFELIDTTDELTPLPPQDYPLSSIGNGQIPNSEQLMDYLQPTYQSIMESSKDGYNIDINDSPHLTDSSKSVSTALSMIVHLVASLSNILNQPLPHPVVLPVVLSEFGKANGKSLQELNRFLAKQDDNIVYLCFTQAVDCNELVLGDTIGNLLKLLASGTLGRTGPFSCYPELLRYPRTKVNRSVRAVSMDRVTDCEPPLLHTARLSPAGTEMEFSTQGEHHYYADEEQEQESTSPDDSCNNIGLGWEEVNERIVPSTNSYYGLSPPSTLSKERLEYGVSYSDYTLNYGQNSTHLGTRSGSSGYDSSGSLMGTLGNLLGSGWIKRQ